MQVLLLKYRQRTKTLPKYISSADTYLKAFLSINNKDNGVAIILTIVFAFVLFVMLLPTLNLDQHQHQSHTGTLF